MGWILVVWKKELKKVLFLIFFYLTFLFLHIFIEQELKPWTCNTVLYITSFTWTPFSAKKIRRHYKENTQIFHYYILGRVKNNSMITSFWLGEMFLVFRSLTVQSTMLLIITIKMVQEHNKMVSRLYFIRLLTIYAQYLNMWFYSIKN